MSTPIETIVDYETALAAGERFLSVGHLISAKEAFERAHGLGHARTRAHVRAHLGLLRVALAANKPLDLVAQAGLATFAQVFTPLLGRGA